MRFVVQRVPARARSQSLVEFAMVVPLFLLILFGLIDFGRLEFSYVSLANAAREMARVASIPANPNSVAVDSFNNYAGLILSAPVAGSDFVTVTVADRTCAALASACAGAHATNSYACPLPLVYATCSVPAYPSGMPNRTGLSGGYVEIKATNHYTFSPLFENRLTGMIDASFMQQLATISTTARAYIE